jgi:hypothetical protein
LDFRPRKAEYMIEKKFAGLMDRMLEKKMLRKCELELIEL